MSKPNLLVAREGKDLGEDTIAVFQAVPTLSAKKKQDELGNVSYHAFPDVKSAKGKQWIQRIRGDPGTNFAVKTKICSEHFSPNDFVCGELPVKDKRRRLLTNAVPSIFPWHPVKKCLSLTSQKALQPLKTECLDQSSCLVTKSLESFSMLTILLNLNPDVNCQL